MYTRKCTLDAYLDLVNSPKQPIQVRTSFVVKIFSKGIIKNLQKK